MKVILKNKLNNCETRDNGPMTVKRGHINFVFILVFMAYFIATFPVFYSTIWLIKEIVIAEVILSGFLAIISGWILLCNKNPINYLIIHKKNWSVFLFLIFSGLSVFWSIFREISVYRWLILFCTIIIGGYIGLNFSIREITKSLSAFGIFILVLCTLFVIFLPSIGVMNYYIIQGAWKGIFWHKNQLGLFASFVSILVLLQLINAIQLREKQKYLYFILYGFSLIVLIKSDSVAGYMTTIFLHGLIFLALIWIKIRQKIHLIHYLIVFIGVIVFSIFLYFNIDHFFGLFNRNASLTGRIPMWSYLFETFFSKRPLLGYGFNAFWYLDTHRIATQQAAGYPDQIVIADNGFIDILLNIGLVGLISFLVLYFDVWWRSIIYTRKADGIYAFFPLVFVAFSLIANISWSLIFENESFYMLVMISVMFCMGKDEKLTAYSLSQENTKE